MLGRFGSLRRAPSWARFLATPPPLPPSKKEDNNNNTNERRSKTQSPPAATTWSQRLRAKGLDVSPGMALAGFVASVGFVAADQANTWLQPLVGGAALSGIPLALLGGMALHSVARPALFRPGLDFAATQALRAGVVCVGFKLRSVQSLSFLS